MLRQIKSLLRSMSIVVVAASCARAASHRQDLNGTWKLAPNRCQFAEGPVLNAGTVTIFDREHNTYVSENFTYDEGGKTITYAFHADAPHNASIHTGPESKTKTKWDDNTLEVTSKSRDTTTTERYSLATDGSLVLTVEKPGHALETLVFERQ